MQFISDKFNGATLVTQPDVSGKLHSVSNILAHVFLTPIKTLHLRYNANNLRIDEMIKRDGSPELRIETMKPRTRN